MSQEFIDAFTDMREEEALKIAHDMLEGGAEPLELLQACKEAMTVISQRFEEGEAFVPELVMAGEIMQQVADVVKPRISTSVETPYLGKVVIGTVVGDIHDIGKDIVVFLLDVNGFEVHDLGVDVPPQKFVEKIKEVKPEVVGLSGFLTLVYDAMKETVDAIEAAGLRDDVKIMIGGGTVDEQIKQYTGADAFGADAVQAVALAQGWVGGK